MQTLAIAVEFLTGAAYLSDPYDSGRTEWPPAPARLYAALIAAAHEFRLGEAVLQAVRSLEDTAPALTVPDADLYLPHTPMVPNAHSPSYPFVRKQYSAQTAHEVVPAGPVIYHWPVPGPAVTGVTVAVEHLYRLGRGESLALARVLPVERTPAPDWRPDPLGDRWLRVPQPGRYQTLERDYRAGRNSAIPDPQIRYRRNGPDPEVAPAGPWGDLLALKVSPKTPVDLRHAALLAEGLRRAVLARLDAAAHPQIHGHQPSLHLAWASLPNVGHAHGDGRLVGVGAWLPRDLEPEAQSQLREALLATDHLVCGGRRIAVGLAKSESAALRRDTWAKPARVWATATPMVLDYRAGDADRSRAVKTALVRAGYPKPVRVIHSSACSLVGGIQAGEVRPRKSPNPRVHALVEFAETVAGPVLAGAERYFGLGLFRPIG